MPKDGFKGDLVKRKAKYAAQNQRTFRNVQKRRAKHDKAHGLPEGTTNSHSKRWVQAPSAK